MKVNAINNDFQLKRITFDTNPDACNYRCIMCECFSPYSQVRNERITKDRSKRVMPFDIIEKVLSDNMAHDIVEIIPSTMGEPLLYKDFEKIASLCKSKNIKLNLTTNGSFPGKGVLEWSEILLPICSDIKISINGASKQTSENIMIGSNFNKTINNLETLINIRNQSDAYKSCTITLQVTFMKSNMEELPNLLELAINKGVDRLKGHQLWAHFKEIEHEKIGHNIDLVRRWNAILEKIEDIRLHYKNTFGKVIRIENFFPISEAPTNDKTNVPIDWECPFLGNEIWIDTEGEFHPCCAPSEKRKQLGHFGNIKDNSLSDIMGGRDYQNLYSNYKDFDLCKSCNMRRPKL